jgi:thiamine biosynthesis lipoprotein ApbE
MGAQKPHSTGTGQNQGGRALSAQRREWAVWGTVARIVVSDPSAVGAAADIARAELDAVDAACSRFRDDSELRFACRSGGRPVTVSPLLAHSCLLANTLSTAAIVRGRGAYDLLRSTPSRLVTPSLDVLRLGGWPA